MTSNAEARISTEPKRMPSKSLVQVISDRFGLHRYKEVLNKVMKISALLAFHAYLIIAIIYHINNDKPILWCDGLGFIIAMVVITYLYLILKLIFCYANRTKVFPKFKEVIGLTVSQQLENKRVRLGCYLFVATFILLFLLIDANGDLQRIISVGNSYTSPKVSIVISLLFLKEDLPYCSSLE